MYPYIESLTALLLDWLIVTAVTARPWRWPLKLLVWFMAETSLFFFRGVVLHGIVPFEALRMALSPFRAVYLLLDYFIIVWIARTDWKPGYQVAAWFTATSSVSIAVALSMGRGQTIIPSVIVFSVGGFIAARAACFTIEEWLDTTAKAAVVVALAAVLTALTITAVLHWYQGAPMFALAAAGVIGLIALPHTAARHLVAQIF